MKDWNGNYNSVIKTLGAHNGILESREENDYYATDPKAIDKLLTVEQPSSSIWECACGEGHLSKALQNKGYTVYSSDLVNRHYGVVGTDFLKFDESPIREQFDILTNPPYKFAKEFVLKALELVEDGQKVFMFLKLTFLEGKTRFKELFSKYPPKRIHVFSERTICAKNGEFEKMQKVGSAIAYAWFVWQKGWTGKTTVDWI